MTKAEKEREIERQWRARPDDQRTPAHVENFAQACYDHGPRLHQQLNQHIELVRYAIDMH